eukprot:SAG31_NODE_49546_length_135_cov_172.083333_1_plen_33_part_01
MVQYAYGKERFFKMEADGRLRGSYVHGINLVNG